MSNIDKILARMGIKETTGSFDPRQGVDEIEQGALENFPDAQLQDNRSFIAGNPKAAKADPQTAITEAQRNEDRAITAGLAPKLVAKKPEKRRNKVKQDTLDQIKRHETLVGTNIDKDGNFLNRIYTDKGAGQGESKRKRNIGPGFNIDDGATLKFLERNGVDVTPLLSNKPLSENDGAKLNGLFEKRVLEAQRDAISFVGNKEDWKKLSELQRKGFTDLAYNLGAKTLNSFKNSKAILSKYLDFKSGRNGFDTSKLSEQELKDTDDYFLAVLGAEVADSSWFDQVGNRSTTVVNQLMNNSNNVSAERWKRVSKGKRSASV